MQELSTRKLFVVFIVVEVEGIRIKVFVSSKQISVATVNSHVPIQISRLAESQETKLALIRFFTAVKIQNENL